ncbi:MAG: acyl-CoA thioesterase [Hydrogenothermaceae bacterium]|nr:acyl-CoA thioesterase [Hydrogenothermaceae bacterium]
MTLTYTRKVNFYETDAQGIVHHSNYPRYFEECRGFYLENIGLPYHILRDEYNVDVVLLELNIRYMNPLRFGDKFKIEFRLDSIDSYFFSFKYEIYTDKKIAEGFTKHCCVNSQTKRVIKVPKVLKDKMELRDVGRDS